MKLLNILGAVIAVHIAVLVLAIVIPGCRSTKSATVPASNPAPTTTMRQPANPTPISAAPEMGDADLNPPLAGPLGSGFDPNAPATSGGGTRFSPTRPAEPRPESLMPTAPVADPVESMATYTVQRGDNLWALAKKNNLSVRELAAANGLPADAGLRVGQVLVIPGQAPAAAAAAPGLAAMAPPDDRSRSYVIRPGDTLGKIARAHGTSVAELKAFNRLSGDMVRAGERLLIPESATVAPSATAEAVTTAPETPVAGPSSDAFKHTVAPGESLAVIANRYGVRIGDIAVANKVRDPSLIRAGQELIIPGWEAPPPAANQPASTPPASDAPAATERIRTLTASPSNPANEDLDVGLEDEDLSNVPVITVDEPVKTIGGGAQSAPVFE